MKSVKYERQVMATKLIECATVGGLLGGGLVCSIILLEGGSMGAAMFGWLFSGVCLTLFAWFHDDTYK